jgi:hypothetical protein
MSKSAGIKKPATPIRIASAKDATRMTLRERLARYRSRRAGKLKAKPSDRTAKRRLGVHKIPLTVLRRLNNVDLLTDRRR